MNGMSFVQEIRIVIKYQMSDMKGSAWWQIWLITDCEDMHNLAEMTIHFPDKI